MGVNRKASNIGCRSETGRFPLKINIDTYIINNWIRLNSLDDKTLVKQALIISKNLHQRGHFSYHSGVCKLLSSYNLTNTTFTKPKLSENQIKNIKDNYISKWKEKLTFSVKLGFYKMFKRNFIPESYLSTITNIAIRKDLCKLRISNHKLMIERGRYSCPKVPREDRLCHLCTSHVIEDEVHFLYVCPLYDKYRKDLFLKIKTTTG